MAKISEIFLPVKGYEGLYEVSNSGIVKTIGRTIYFKTKHGTRSYPVKEKIKISNLTPRGYITISLVRNNITKTTYLHKIIAEAFMPNPDNYRCINHKNGIKSDNRIENLEWCNHSHNNIHALDTFLRTPTRSLDISKINEIVLLSKSGKSIDEICVETSLSKYTIRRLLSGKSHKRIIALYDIKLQRF